MRFGYQLAAITMALLVQNTGAAVAAMNESPREGPPRTEAYNTGWAIYVDNDLLGGTDRNYTFGFAVTLSGRRATEYALSLDPALQAVNGWLGVKRLFDAPDAPRRHDIAFGLTAFTPQDLAEPAPILDDQPYACLAFANNSEQVILAGSETSYQTTFTLGLLGTSVCESLQTQLHDLVGDDEPRGWNHQIADGGEPTFQWSLSRQQVLVRSAGEGSRHEVTGMMMGAVGYTTHIGAGLAWRWGRIRSPWWSFTPHHVDYINLGSPGTRRGGPANGPGELYLWARAMLRYQLYNAFLQGQFRDSDVVFSRSDLNPLIGEAWIGVTKELDSGLDVSFSLRARSRAVKTIDSSAPVWGSVILRRAF